MKKESGKLLWLFGIIVCLFGIFVGFFHIHNADVWWHIAWGEEMLKQHTLFPSAEFFYFTPTTTDYLRELPNTFLGDIGLALLLRSGGTLALQLLVLLSLFGGAYFLLFVPWRDRLKQDPRWIPIVCLIFVLFCLGTAQLQVVRNSIVSLAFFPLTLFLYTQHVDKKKLKVLVFYAFLFFFWSWIHPSYLLGIVALFLLYGGEFLSLILKTIRNRTSSSPIPMARTLLVLLVIFLLTLTYSWQPRQLVTTGIRHTISSMMHCVKTESKSPSGSQDTFAQITQPTWAKSSAPLSGDFIPTWTVLHHPAAWSSLLLALLAWIALFLFRAPHKIGMTALLALTTYFGICYFRGTGYLTIASLFTIVHILPNLELWPRHLTKIIIPTAAVISLLFFFGIIGLTYQHQTEFFFKEKGRIFGIGKAAVFNDDVYQFVKEHFPTKPCFTTIVTGSYASFLWTREKKVFIDAFFAPHPKNLWRDYNQLTTTEETSLLDPYGVEIALVENSRLDWQSFFLRAPMWRPIALGKGVTLYGKQSLISAEAPAKILFDISDIISLAPTERRALAAAYYNSILILQLHHLSKAAAATINQNPVIFVTLAHFLDLSQQGNIRLEPPSIKPCLLTP